MIKFLQVYTVLYLEFQGSLNAYAYAYVLEFILKIQITLLFFFSQSHRNTSFTNQTNKEYIWNIFSFCLNLGFQPFSLFIKQVKKQSKAIREGTDEKAKLNSAHS